eukprot:4864264-Pleurochrysis_carterae.AAC.5
MPPCGANGLPSCRIAYVQAKLRRRTLADESHACLWLSGQSKHADVELVTANVVESTFSGTARITTVVALNQFMPNGSSDKPCNWCRAQRKPTLPESCLGQGIDVNLVASKITLLAPRWWLCRSLVNFSDDRRKAICCVSLRCDYES